MAFDHICWSLMLPDRPHCETNHDYLGAQNDSWFPVIKNGAFIDSFMRLGDVDRWIGTDYYTASREAMSYVP